MDRRGWWWSVEALVEEDTLGTQDATIYPADRRAVHLSCGGWCRLGRVSTVTDGVAPAYPLLPADGAVIHQGVCLRFGSALVLVVVEPTSHRQVDLDSS